MLTPPPEEPPTTPPSNPHENTSLPIDITQTYNHLLHTDPLLTHPIAAIESLITLLSTSPAGTISETLALLSSATNTLKTTIPNPIPLSAGTDLFQRYIISTLQSRSSSHDHNARGGGKGKRNHYQGGVEDFRAIRAHLLANSRLFVQRAKEARGKIARVARKFVRDGSVVMTCGRSRVVAATLKAAAEEGVRFRVVYAEDSYSYPSSISAGTTGSKTTDVVGELRARGVPVAVIPFAGVATALGETDFVIVGAESVVENGGVVSGMGTYQMGLLAKSAGRPFYVGAESHKFVRVFPLDWGDLPVRRRGLDFRIEEKERRGVGEGEGEVDVDFTPPELITAIVTENGVQTPSAVSEELIKIWY
ncbi:hypothetical protein JMJ35_005555 [Cladonia borealis]|uniref:Translation initiation factor eIF2B subunit alpha n=1 Tax=Cladonia borealis TaxID=184061 RepID=A0AA39V1R9_9LECA|nr:hypothetical protein JMJ35_005555 [Cladonia borealis]